MMVDREATARSLLAHGAKCEIAEDWAGAIDDYEQVLSLAPMNLFTRYFGHNNLAFSLIKVGRYAEAAWHCDQAIQTNPQRHNAHKNLGLALQGLGRNAEAAIAFVTAARLEPHDPRAMIHLRALLDARPDLDGDSSALRQVLAELGSADFGNIQ